MLEFKNSVFKLKPIGESSILGEVKKMLINGEQILSAYESGRDQIVFTNKRVIAVDVKGIVGKKKEFSSLPYSKVQHFTVQTPGFMELLSDGELILGFANGILVQFEFGGKVDIISICKSIGECIL